jgi:death-on-curing family protein
MSTITPLTIQQIEYVVHSIARETMSWSEPIPEFATRFPYKLESCLAVPFQTFNKRLLYRGLTAKAAILFYLLIKNHPFENGNKRIAVTTLLYFLYKNKKWLRVNNYQLYNFAKWVAESDAILKNETVAAIEKFIHSYIIDFVEYQ